MVRAPYLFSWKDVEAQSELDRLQLVIDAMPDQHIVEKLQKNRGKGRNDYPVRAMWNALLAGVVYQHPNMASLLRELRRNGELREMCGFDPLKGADAVPKEFNMSRFLQRVIALEPEIRELFNGLVRELTAVLPDLGRHLSFDGKALPSYSTGKTSDPEGEYGRKSYRGVGKDGKPWEKVVKWFGYQLHLIVDSDAELPVAFEVQAASASEVTRLLPLVNQLQEQQPKLLARTRELAADRGLDSGPVNQALLADYGVRPIIDTRALWRQEKQEQGRDPAQTITRPLFPKRVDTLVYSERGEVRCVCPATGEARDLAFMGYEADRESLKYRCPAAAYGFVCAGRAECATQAPGNPGPFGRIVRVPLATDYRIFLPTPRNSPSFARSYAKRTSVERVNSRIDNVLGFERHTIRGLKKMQARMGLALVVMLAMALGRIRMGRPDQMRSLVGRVEPPLRHAA